MANPIKGLENIYENLGLKDFPENKKRFSSYINTQKHVKGASYDIDDSVVEKLKKRWDFVFKEFKYQI